ncbi:Hypothetical predicted protein [Lecanosticta acicola]|uniref:Uncharacterized protein n=1 Tax=Lecanosticta acicola TaxID=111012 RepID=A0AAI8YSB9_9PEZI|nr:Hypothetical predicted protein [Lecanosticta acicola]
MKEYNTLPQSEDDDVPGFPREPRRNWPIRAISAVLLTSILVNVIVLARVIKGNVAEKPPQGRYAQTPDLDTVWKRFFWHTKWDSGDRNQSDALWNGINPAHGFVAIDREQAASKGWPESMYLPSDHSKGVYLLEAYHQLHCLKIVRQTFREAVQRLPYTYDPHHAEHCFDALRQSTVCNADNTPLYTFGDKTAGDGQMHKCRSWSQLSQYATDNSACYRDSVGDIPLGQHFGHCEEARKDGIDPHEFQVEAP